MILRTVALMLYEQKYSNRTHPHLSKFLPQKFTHQVV